MTLFDYDRLNALWKALRDWFHWQAIEGAEISPRVVFPNYPMAVEAALSGQGVILGSRALVRDYLDRGQLVQLSQQVLFTGYGYYVGLPKDRPTHQDALRVQQWLLDRTKPDPHQTLGPTQRPPHEMG
jgi:LysR family glycine cleavage system transcriptional activator